jgi:hypothetical protein
LLMNAFVARATGQEQFISSDRQRCSRFTHHVSNI